MENINMNFFHLEWGFVVVAAVVVVGPCQAEAQD
jgi:hypothetical protein